MLPLPAIRTVSAPAPLRKAVKAVDDYTLWAFNPQRQLVSRYRPAEDRRTDRTA
jgi:hypothetical protein